MSVIVDFSLAANEFPLGELLEVRPGVEIRLESIVPTSKGVIPYFWVQSRDADAVEEVLEPSPLVVSVTRLDQVDHETLFRVQWSEEVNGLVDAIRANEGAIVSGDGRGDRWWFQLRFPDHASLSAFYAQTTRVGLVIDLEMLHQSVADLERARFELTDEQVEVLRLAHQMGYFSVPRKSTMVDIAADLGISDTAASQRLRRGLAKLVENAFATEGRDGAGDRTTD